MFMQTDIMGDCVRVATKPHFGQF